MHKMAMTYCSDLNLMRKNENMGQVNGIHSQRPTMEMTIIPISE